MILLILFLTEVLHSPLIFRLGYLRPPTLNVVIQTIYPYTHQHFFTFTLLIEIVLNIDIIRYVGTNITVEHPVYITAIVQVQMLYS